MRLIATNFFFYFRAHTLYFTLDGSRQGYSWLVGKKKIKYACGLMSEKGKKKGKIHESLVVLTYFSPKKYAIVSEHLWHVGGENKIKAK